MLLPLGLHLEQKQPLILQARKEEWLFGAKHRGKIGMGLGAAGIGIAAGRTRRSGLNKTSGRPTGMYKY